MTIEIDWDAKEIHRRHEFQERTLRTTRASRRLTELEKAALSVFADTLTDSMPIAGGEYDEVYEHVVKWVVDDQLMLKVLAAMEAESVFHDGNYVPHGALGQAADEVLEKARPVWEATRK